jgi:hypothetical protein
MRKIIFACAAMLCFAGAAAAQDSTTATTTTATVTDDSASSGATAAKVSNSGGYPWQVGMNFTYQKFDIGGGDSNLYGIHSTVTRWIGDSWFGLEGSVSAAFGSLNAHDREQLVFYGGGAHVGKRSGKYQPWAHFLAGGAHDRFNQEIGPSSFNTFGLMGGGGLDIQWRSHIAWRVQGDYLGTRFGSVWQKSATVGVGILFDF